MPHNSLPLQVQNAVPAHDRGFLLNDSRVAQFQGPLGQSAWASNGLFLSGSGPCGDLFTIATRKGRPRRRSISICDSRPVAESYILPLYNDSRHLKIRRRPGFCHRVALNLLGSICVVSPRLSRTRHRESLFQTRSLAKIGDISNAHRLGDRLLRECRPASDRRHEKRLMVMALERLVGRR